MRNRKAAMKQQVQTGAYNVKSPAANKCFKDCKTEFSVLNSSAICIWHYPSTPFTQIASHFRWARCFPVFFGFHFTLEKNHSSVPHKIEMRNFQWPINSHWNIRSFMCLDYWDSLRAFILNWCTFDPFWQSTQLGIRTSIVCLCVASFRIFIVASQLLNSLNRKYVFVSQLFRIFKHSLSLDGGFKTANNSFCYHQWFVVSVKRLCFRFAHILHFIGPLERSGNKLENSRNGWSWICIIKSNEDRKMALHLCNTLFFAKLLLEY